MARIKKPTTKVETLKHKDKRTNIPTEELRDFVAEDEKKPKVMLYPRDPSLDPQLVWKGKDEQDSKDLAVPVVPVYIQEKIHPQALVDDFLRRIKEGRPSRDRCDCGAPRPPVFREGNRCSGREAARPVHVR